MTCIGTLVTLKQALVAKGVLFNPIWGTRITPCHRIQAIKQRDGCSLRTHMVLLRGRVLESEVLGGALGLKHRLLCRTTPPVQARAAAYCGER